MTGCDIHREFDEICSFCHAWLPTQVDYALKKVSEAQERKINSEIWRAIPGSLIAGADGCYYRRYEEIPDWIKGAH